MNTRDYEVIAAAIRDARPQRHTLGEIGVFRDVVLHIAAALSKNDYAFNMKRFFDACGVLGPTAKEVERG